MRKQFTWYKMKIVVGSRNSEMKIRNIIIVVLFFFFIGKEIYSQDTNNYKIYIQPFEYKSGPSYFKYYTSSLPKSIRNTINKKIKTIMGEKT